MYYPLDGIIDVGCRNVRVRVAQMWRIGVPSGSNDVPGTGAASPSCGVREVQENEMQSRTGCGSGNGGEAWRCEPRI